MEDAQVVIGKQDAENREAAEDVEQRDALAWLYWAESFGGIRAGWTRWSRERGSDPVRVSGTFLVFHPELPGRSRLPVPTQLATNGPMCCGKGGGKDQKRIVLSPGTVPARKVPNNSYPSPASPGPLKSPHTFQTPEIPGRPPADA